MKQLIINFLQTIQLNVEYGQLDVDTFLPGLQLKNGAIIIDEHKLLYPGDILHEAGHLATMPPSVRNQMSETLPVNDQNSGGEMMAQAWSYAACVYLGIDPHVVFHLDGYKGASENLIANFGSGGQCIGLPLLQWAGLTYDAQNAGALGIKPFPHMIKWLRDE